MRIVWLTAISVIFFSCKKDVQASGFDNYFNNLLICDSIKTETNTDNSVVAIGKGRGYDLLFSPSGNTGKYGTVGTFMQYSSPIQTVNFRYERPDKLYYWPQNSTMTEGDYFTIISATGKSVVLHHLKIGSDIHTWYYYTPQ